MAEAPPLMPITNWRRSRSILPLPPPLLPLPSCSGNWRRSGARRRRRARRPWRWSSGCRRTSPHSISRDANSATLPTSATLLRGGGSGVVTGEDGTSRDSGGGFAVYVSCEVVFVGDLRKEGLRWHGVIGADSTADALCDGSGPGGYGRRVP
jgi:hypothetical protein